MFHARSTCRVITRAVRLRYARTIHGVIRNTVHIIQNNHQHHHITHEKVEC